MQIMLFLPNITASVYDVKLHSTEVTNVTVAVKQLCYHQSKVCHKILHTYNYPVFRITLYFI